MLTGYRRRVGGPGGVCVPQRADVAGVGPEPARGMLRAQRAALPGPAAGPRRAAPLAAPAERVGVDLQQRGAGVGGAGLADAAVGLAEVVDEVVDAGVVRPPPRQERHPRRAADGDLACRGRWCVCVCV